MLRLFRKEKPKGQAEEASPPTRESPPSLLTRIGSVAADLTRGTRSSQSPRKAAPASSSSFSQHAKESSTSMLSKSVLSRPSMASPWPTLGALRVLRSDAAAPLGMKGLCFASATHSIEGERHGMEDYNVSADMGNGVALVPGLTVQTEIAAGTLVRVRIKELQFERKLRLVYRKQANLSHAAVAFLKVVEAYAAAHGAPYSFTPERTG